MTTSGQNIPVGNGAVYIGGLLGQQYFDGYIDEVSIYTAALSTSEIREIFSHGSIGKCKN